METKKIETAVELDNVSFEYEEGKSGCSGRLVEDYREAGWKLEKNYFL